MQDSSIQVSPIAQLILWLDEHMCCFFEVGDALIHNEAAYFIQDNARLDQSYTVKLCTPVVDSEAPEQKATP